MTSKAEKLLEQMRQSKANWKMPRVNAFAYIKMQTPGFIITHGSRHDKVKHPDFIKVRELRGTLPRHRFIDKVYVDDAIKRIDRLLELMKGK